jgi:hypothetical protein
MAKRILLLIVCVSLALVTTHKLYIMCAIKRWLPGAQAHGYRVRQKLVTKEELEDAYWISWTSEDIRQPGNHRTNIPREQWANLRIGDPVEIITVGDDPAPYVRDDIFVSPGNFGFDIVLLVAEVSGIVLAVRGLLRARDRANGRIWGAG